VPMEACNMERACVCASTPTPPPPTSPPPPPHTHAYTHARTCVPEHVGWCLKGRLSVERSMSSRKGIRKLEMGDWGISAVSRVHGLMVADDEAGARSGAGGSASGTGCTQEACPVFRQTPFRTYSGHKQDVLDVSWSASQFLLSASMDKTVRLWHISMDDCLRVFKHPDFVTSLDFHPVDDKVFLSGAIDGKVLPYRLHNVGWGD
jgi:WD domain, G-beta repeat